MVELHILLNSFLGVNMVILYFQNQNLSARGDVADHVTVREIVTGAAEVGHATVSADEAAAETGRGAVIGLAIVVIVTVEIGTVAIGTVVIGTATVTVRR
jgi:hypothetical protein